MAEPIPYGLEAARHLALAGLTGLAVGIEREWSGHASGPRARFGGVRTFLLLGLTGGIGGWLAEGGWISVGAALIGSAGLLTVLAYGIASQQTGDRDGTTEAAALLVLATGALCGLGYAAVGSGVAAVAVLALAEKSRIRGLIARIDETELRAGFRFAVLALVVLPLLPVGPYGPYGAIRPRELWTIVLIFSGLNFAGYVARRAVGPDRGNGITGLLGGLVSSTAVALTFSRRSRVAAADTGGLALGVVAACTMLLPRVFAVALAIAPPVARHLTPYLLAPAVIGGVIVALALRRKVPAPGGVCPSEASPLGLLSAIRMAAAFQAVLLAVPFVSGLWGRAGLLGSAAVLGLTDMDALTYSMARLGAGGAPALAARAIAVGVLANTVLKLGLVLVLGSAPFRRAAAPGLGALGAAAALALLVA